MRQISSQKEMIKQLITLKKMISLKGITIPQIMALQEIRMPGKHSIPGVGT